MKIRLLREETIRDYYSRHARGKAGFLIWLRYINNIDWSNANDIVYTWNGADLLGNGSDRVIFNIGGNKYRLLCKYYFGRKFVHLYVCWIGTHSAYDKLCDSGNQYHINQF